MKIAQSLGIDRSTVYSDKVEIRRAAVTLSLDRYLSEPFEPESEIEFEGDGGQDI